MDRWQGKVAVVTGASAGIGSAICLAFADAGLTVVGFARRTHLIDNLKAEVRGKGSICSRECDVSKAEDIAAAFAWVEEQFGGVDVLVNNAGALFNGQITDGGAPTLSETEIASTIDTNLKGLVFCTRRAVTSMKKRRFDGHIFNISSVVGHYIPSTPTFNVYPCTKHAVTAFGGSLNNELAQHKSRIKTTSVSPGLVRTALAAGLIDRHALPVLQPADVASAVLWALSTPPHLNITELTINAVEQTSL